MSAQDGNAESNRVVERSDGRYATHSRNARDPHLTHMRQLLDFEPETQGLEEPWNLIDMTLNPESTPDLGNEAELVHGSTF